MEFFGKSFTEAVELLTGEQGAAAPDRPSPAPLSDFRLPPRSDTAGQVKSYLTEARRIDEDVMGFFFASGDKMCIRDRGITEAQALQSCYDRGFDFSGLYEIYHRASCWCCPFQRIDELRKLRKHHPELWEKLLELDRRALAQFGTGPLGPVSYTHLDVYKRQPL